jgi:hypothetical protein
MYPDKFARTTEDVPNVEHWVILKNDGVYVPGDERSRTNPGHGYPASTHNYLDYHVYLTEEKLLKAIEELETPQYGGNRTAYRVIKVTPMAVKKQVNISVVDKI